MTLIECSKLGYCPRRVPIGVAIVISTGDTPHPKEIEGLVAWMMSFFWEKKDIEWPGCGKLPLLMDQ